MKFFLLAGLMVFGSALFANSKVLRESGPTVVVSEGHLYSTGQRIAFARPDSVGDLVVIANGSVKSVSKKEAVIDLDPQFLTKRPNRGDTVISLGPPKIFPDPKTKAGNETPMFATDVPPDLEPGYFSFGYRYSEGKMESTSSSQANSLKDISGYNPTGFNLEWFFDFMPSYGLVVQSGSGVVPVFAYNQEEVPSVYSRTEIQLLYRLKPIPPGIRFVFFLDSLSESFSTDNSDEYILNSSYSSLGFGTRIGFENGAPFELQHRSHFRFQQLFIEGIYFPSISAVDGEVSRGNSSDGSQRTELKVGATFLFGVSWAWWLSHFFLEVQASQSQLDLQFGGPTASEVGGVYVIPENTTGSEAEQIYSILIGVRFQDVVGKLFKPRN